MVAARNIGGFMQEKKKELIQMIDSIEDEDILTYFYHFFMWKIKSIKIRG